MDDAELKRMAEAATPGPWEIDVFGDTSVKTPNPRNAHVATTSKGRDANFIALANPRVVLGLLSRLYAAEARVGVLEEALRVAPILSKYHGMNGFEVERFIRDYDAFKTRIDGTALTQEPTS
jgi:hypothetical protein